MRQTIHKMVKNNRSNQPLKPIGVVLHETATPGATAQAEYRYFDSEDRGASAHAFVDWTQTIQTIPWREKAWHAKEPANSMFISIEMCRPIRHDPIKFKIIYNESVLLISRIFRLILNIDLVTKDNLMSHQEVSDKWHNSTHVDPTAYLKEYGKTMDDFRKDVQIAINKLKG